MVVTAQHLRTALTLAAAGGTVALALAVHTRGVAPVSVAPVAIVDADAPDDGMTLTAKLTSAKVMAGAHEQNIAITVTAPAGRVAKRPPLSLAVVIDRSGSMHGAPMENAKSAAIKVIEQLDVEDAFTVVTFSSGVETVMPMTRATPAGLAAARSAIAGVVDDGGTCISCGISRGALELERSPVHDGLRRMVLMSDGHANEGLYDRGDLAQLAAQTAAKGVSISAVGVGLDFDELTMTNLASVGRGNYYFVENTADLSAMFAKELGGLAETVASDARLTITTASGVTVLEAYGYPIEKEGAAVIIPIADLRAGETRKVVVHAMVAAQVGPLDAMSVRLQWRRVADRSLRNATATAHADVVADEAQVAASIDRPAMLAAEEARQAHALEEASAAYQKDGVAAAQAVMAKRRAYLDANRGLIGDKWVDENSAEGDTMVRALPAAPAKAMKVMRTKAYDLAR